MLNLDALEKNMGSIIGFPKLDSEYNREVLFIRGGNSDYVNGDGQREIKCLFPSAELRTINGAGHWLHADKTKEFIRILVEYLAF